MDPQQRIALELCWACFEDAGIQPGVFSGQPTGVYLGVFNYDYKELLERQPYTIYAHHASGSAVTVIANRISYFFNFKGPSFSIDTACSSSLSAIHQAVKALQNNECTQAFAGGINILLTPTRHISFSKTGMLSPTGFCHSFDQNADGYVRGEGAGIVLLKPLQKAIADKNHIYGIIKGIAINHGGKAYTLTYPNNNSQADVIHDAWSAAGLSAHDMQYMEAHGTGTPKGDPIEWQGLEKAYQRLLKNGAMPKVNSCGIGSVKTNIGHLEAAAGIAGVIKVLLAIKHKKFPGLANFSALNSRIESAASPFYPVVKVKDWDTTLHLDQTGKPYPRRAGVSSFGFGGTNAHVVLEEYIDNKCNGSSVDLQIKATGKSTANPVIIVLSAKHTERLKTMVTNLYRYLKKYASDHSIHIQDIAYTLQIGREAMEERLAMVVKDKQERQDKLQRLAPTDNASDIAVGDGVYRGRVKNNAKTSTVAHEDIATWLAQHDTRIIEHWVQGQAIDWSLLYTRNATPKRISLPTYPFAKNATGFVRKINATITSRQKTDTGCIPWCTKTPQHYQNNVFKARSVVKNRF